MNYLLISSLDGIITFTGYWSENQTVKPGETVFTVIPMEKGGFMGKALLPIERSGKVKPGQKVNIHFINFPEKEFGTVKGEVKNISLVPVENNYVVDIAFPNGLKTSYGKELPFSQEMHAQAYIITDDLRLIERLFMPLRKIFADK